MQNKNREKFLAIDIGSSGVRLAEVRVEDGFVGIIKYASQDLQHSWETSASYELLVERALSEAIQKSGTTIKECAVSLCSRNIFDRMVRIPTFGHDDVDRKEQIIEFEARQNIPFPMEEVVYGYHCSNSKDEEYGDTCTFSVIKKDEYDKIVNALENNGLSPFFITGNSFALLNGFNACTNRNAEGARTLIDVGETNTNVTFMDGENYMIRTVPLGSASITKQISKEFGLPAPESEDLKLRYVHKEWAEDDSQCGELEVACQKIARNVFLRIKGELNRSIAVFRAHNNCNAIGGIFVTGRGIPESAAKIAVTNPDILGKIGLPDTMNYAMNQHIDVKQNLSIIGLAEMIANKDAKVINFCSPKPKSSIIWAGAMKLAGFITIPLRIRCKFYLKEKKNARKESFKSM